jgi:hypothetical protein
VTARWALEPDLCDMPIGYGQVCNLPADHTDGCRWPEPPCKCAHSKRQHGTDRRGRFICYGSRACGCIEFREKAS